MTNAARWDSVTVVGCGLVGASFALALKRARVCRRVAGWDVSHAALDEALARGCIDEVDRSFAATDAVSPSDLVYLATPVGQIVEFLRTRAGQVKAGAVVTDAGSTKVEVCRAALEARGRGWSFVGGHPVAGGVRGGPAHARADLFDGAPYVLAPAEDGSDPEALAALAETLERIGARVTVLSARGHDRALALTSHLPQLLSSALASIVEEGADADALRALSGPGYRDMTRLSGSDWRVWLDIFMTNPAEVADALERLLTKLTAARDELRRHSQDGGGALAATAALFKQQ